VRTAVGEMARVSGSRVLLVDTRNMGDDVELAEKLRDPSHVRNYSDAEWREIVCEARLGIEEVLVFEHELDFGAWLARTGCEGEEAERVTLLLGDRVQGGRLTLAKIAIKAQKTGF
jgi:plasmid stability protein